MSGTVPTPDESRRFPALDGLRGVAILMVLIHHGAAIGGGFPVNEFDRVYRHIAGIGWAGVDLFFVLSGFLITGILLDSRGWGGAVGSFYGRRALRIIPVYATLLIALLIVLPLVVPSMRDNADLEILRDNKWWYITFTMNFMVVFDPLASLGRFGNGQLWSLMVEEQFYLFWPFVILFTPRRAILPVIFVTIVGAFLLRCAMVNDMVPHTHNAIAAMGMMPARMDSFAWGALLAFCMRDGVEWRRLKLFLAPAAAVAVLGLVGVSLYQGSLHAFEPGTQTIGFSCLAIIFAFMVGLATSGERSWFTQALTHPFLRFFGAYSYALYVFHFQIMTEVSRNWHESVIFGGTTISRIIFTVITVWFSVIVAWLSWHLIERHALALKRYFPRHESVTSTVAEPAPAATTAGG